MAEPLAYHGPRRVRMNHPFDSNNKDLAERWSQWQPDAPLHNDETQANGLPERQGRQAPPHGIAFGLRSVSQSLFAGRQAQGQRHDESIAQELDTLQNLFTPTSATNCW